MYLSLNWLKKYLPDLDISDLEEFKTRVDTRLSEVESITRTGDILQKLVVAKVEGVEKHPTLDKLSVCQVAVGGAKLANIVCGAANVRAGMFTVAALPGGAVYDPNGGTLKIESRQIGGVKSEGMLCAPDELGLGDDHRGIIEIDSSMAIGTDVTNMFNDVIIEIENKALPHRPDAFSHLGIAREFSAIFDLDLTEPNFDEPSMHADDQIEISIDNKIPDLVSRYSALAISNVHIGPSPLWLQIALSRAGERSINNVVDITNYVMHHIGQPLHAFDADKLDGHKIIVRTAQDGEKMNTLDGEQRTLTKDMIVIADKSGPIALGGVMGGLESEISTDSQNIVLEAANFEKYNIRRTSRELGLRSEASSRFEKGISATDTLTALKAAAEMIVSMAGGEISSDLVDDYPNPIKEQTIDFDLSAVRRLAGVEIAKADMIEKLTALGFKVSGSAGLSASLSREDMGAQVQVTIPSWRQDINIPADLVEEIVRLYGYENIEPTLPNRKLTRPVENVLRDKLHSIKQLLAANGFNEIYTYSMVGDELYEANLLDPHDLLAIENPLSPELAKVRDQVLPSLMEKVKINLDRYDEFGLFEISRVAYAKQKNQEMPDQPYKLAAVFTDIDLETAYRKLKHGFEVVNERMFAGQIKINPASQSHSILHPGMAGELTLAGESIGMMGVVHPQALENQTIKTHQVAAFEINLTTAFAAASDLTLPKYSNITNFPIVNRDISFWQAPHTFIADTILAIRTELKDNLFSIRVIDIFDNKEGKRSISLRLKLQADHTLAPEEIEELTAKVEKLITDHKHELR